MFAALCCNSTAIGAFLCATFAGHPELFAETRIPGLTVSSELSASDVSVNETGSTKVACRELTRSSQPKPPGGWTKEENSIPTLPASAIGVAKSHQSLKPVMPKGINSEGYSPTFESATYRYLNYVTLSCDTAFPNEGQSTLLMVFTTRPQLIQWSKAVSCDQSASIHTAQRMSSVQDHSVAQIQQEAPSEIALLGLQGSQKDAAIKVQTKQNSTASHSRRAISSIRLSYALKTTSESGEALQVPAEDASSVLSQHPVEHHYVPAPWHRSHASRNTYPIRYQPLYFEDPNMERCGETGSCLTEVKSIAHFAGRIPLLPYMMASDSPHKCVRALPDCPTCQQFGPDAYLPKPTVKAIAVQAAATVGAIYVIP